MAGLGLLARTAEQRARPAETRGENRGVSRFGCRFVTAVAAVVVVSGPSAYGAERGRELWGAVAIVPGREGIVEVAGHTDAALEAGSRLTLTAPEGAEVTGMPLRARGYRGAVAAGGGSGTYTFTGTGSSWRGRGFPFVLAVPGDAVPGTRLRGCAVRLVDGGGVVKDTGGCEVTVGLPEPTLTRPESGVPLSGHPEMAGTAYPGAQVTVRYWGKAESQFVTGQGPKDGSEVCTATAASDGAWSCVPGTELPSRAGLLQAVAAFGGVRAVSEQVNVTVS